MAGRARYQALTEELTRRTKQAFEVEENEPIPSSLDYVCSLIESGQTAKAIAADLSLSLPFQVDYAMLMRYLRAEHGENTDSDLEQARARASHSLVEDALTIVDAPVFTMMDVSQAASRARQRNWMAERYNPSKYGQSKGVSVSVTVGSLHLDALKHVSTLVTGTAQRALPSPAHNTAVVGQVIAVDGVSVE